VPAPGTPAAAFVGWARILARRSGGCVAAAATSQPTCLPPANRHFRARSFSWSAPLSAVAPFIGPVIFLALPTRVGKTAKATVADAPETPARGVILDETATGPGTVEPAAGGTDPGTAGRDARGVGAPGNASVPTRPVHFQTAVFLKTKFPGFFGTVRHGAEADLVLIIKSALGEFEVRRISRIAANELYLESRQAPLPRKVVVSFTEIREIRLKTQRRVGWR